MKNILRQCVAVLLLTMLAACGSSSGGVGDAVGDAVDESQCSTIGQNRFVYEVMQDIYFWVQFLPTVNPDTYPSPEALLEDIRYQVLDSVFSTIRDEEENDRFFNEGEFIGVGLTLRIVGDQIFVVQVIGDSPADTAGFARGYELLEINGQTAAALVASDSVSAAFGADEVGTPVDLRFRDGQGNESEITLSKAVAVIRPVPFSTVFDLNGVQTGYLMFRTFIEPSFAALDDTFADFASQGVTEIVLDLRYNGGGLVSVAEHLGGLIGGQGTSGQVFSRYVHNANNVSRNRSISFPNPAFSLGVSRLIVITTESTASASELVINALRPYMQVVIIGERTFGKPVGSYGFPFCGKTLNPISFNLRNADDQGDYYDGLPVDCTAADDLSQPFGDPAEASTAEALYYVENGVCSPTVAGLASERRGTSRARPPAGDDWQLLKGVF